MKKYLSPEDIEEIKDETRFRTRVILSLKNLEGVPQRTFALEVKMKIYAAFTTALVVGLIGISWKVIVK